MTMYHQVSEHRFRNGDKVVLTEAAKQMSDAGAAGIINSRAGWDPKRSGVGLVIDARRLLSPPYVEVRFPSCEGLIRCAPEHLCKAR